MTVQTHPQVTRDLRLATRQGLLPARGGGWLAGFGNMFAKELGEWFRTRRWLWQFLIWLIIINGFVGFMLYVIPMLEAKGLQTVGLGELAMIPPESLGFYWAFGLAVLFGIIGVIILAQDEIIQERQSGTAAWILSKPAARSAFILTKLLSNLLGALIFIVVLPGLVTLGETYLAVHKVVSLMSFLAGTGVVWLALACYISLVIMLGVLFGSRGPVLGIALGTMFGGRMIAGIFPPIAYVLPVTMDGIAQAVVLGMPLPVMLVSQVISTAVLTIVFTLVALWRFQKIEL
jgi:ABC-2 type transport system permease protein